MHSKFRYTILMQGGVSKWTSEIVNEYLIRFPDARILLSTWTTENVDKINCEIIQLEQPKIPKPHESTVNHQIIGASEGLKKIDNVIKKRNENAKRMDSLLSTLSPNLIIPKRPKGYRETFALYMCLVKNRDKLLKYLIKNKIEAKIHYPIPLNKQKAARNLKLNQKDFTNANGQAKKIITLPIHQYLSKKQISYIAHKIKNFYKKQKHNKTLKK